MSESENQRSMAQSVSFTFSKKTSSNVQKDKLQKEDELNPDDKDYVQKLEEKTIHSTLAKPEKKPLVIPLITANRWRFSAGPKKDAEDKKEDKEIDPEAARLEEQATKEILEEVAAQKESANGTNENFDRAIPLVMQNRVPEGFETDEQMDVSLRADESTLDDYMNVPIEEYGMAMLRGMGWKPEPGKKGVGPADVVLRPKGLGLGANPRPMQSKPSGGIPAGKDEENLQLVKGAYVRVIAGKHEGQYGQVESLDENNARVVVKLAVGASSVNLTELAVQPVSTKEYKDCSRVLNKNKYEEYKSKIEKKLEASREEERSQRRKRSRSRSPVERKEDRRTRDKERERNHKKEDAKSRQDKPPVSWLFPMLRVRCVDKKYRRGEYYKQKVIVVDMVSQDLCVCKTEDGKLLEGVKVSQLETVIPRGPEAFVRVVRGKRKGQLGQILSRDKKENLAAVQTWPDRDEILRLDYEDICEYVGNVEADYE